MKIIKLFMFLLVSMLTMGNDFIALERDSLEKSKKLIEENNEYVLPAYEELITKANEALEVERYSVVDKKVLAASGDPHDFMSFGPYWWPNPDTKDGFPYIRKDGEANPESRNGDRTILNRFAGAVENLGLAYYFTGEEKYAKKSAELIKTWFIDEETKMNPNLKYSQAIPGEVDGRHIGIIDAQVMPKVLDSIVLIDNSNQLTEDDMTKIKEWFREYLDWLVHGEYAYAVKYHPNNHGTLYDVQVAGIAIFLEDEETAKDVIRLSQYVRLGAHTGSKGENYHELARTKPYNYSLFDLEGLMTLAQYSKRYDDIDYYNFTVNLSSLPKTINFLNGYAFDVEKWTEDGYLGKAEKDPNFARSYLSFAQASKVYGLDDYEENLYKAWEKDPTNSNILKWPIDFKN